MVLGRRRFLMGEVPLHRRLDTPHVLENGPAESGLDCLVCAEFAREMCELTLAMGGFPPLGPYGRPIPRALWRS